MKLPWLPGAKRSPQVDFRTFVSNAPGLFTTVRNFVIKSEG
jgi:hypothetical protein